MKKTLLIALLMVGLLCSHSLGAETDNALLSATIILPARNVAMGDITFPLIRSDGLSYVKVSSDLTFSSTLDAWVLGMWNTNPGTMMSGTYAIPIHYWFDEGGASSPEMTGVNWGTSWANIVSDAKVTLATGTGVIDKSTPGNSTLDFGVRVDTGQPDGDYTTTVYLEMISP